MPGGQWVAFDVSTDVPHEHNKVAKKRKTIPSSSIKPKKEPTQSEIQERSGEVHKLNDLPADELDLTPFNLAKLFNKLILEKKRIRIQYTDRYNEKTTRTLYPLSLVQGSNDPKKQEWVSTKKLIAYCTLDKDYRFFLLSSMGEVLSGEKIPKSFWTKWNSLSKTKRNKILGGDTGYEQDLYHQQQASLNDKSTTSEVTKTLNKQTVKTEKSNFNEWFWAIFIIVLLFLIFR